MVCKKCCPDENSNHNNNVSDYKDVSNYIKSGLNHI